MKSGAGDVIIHPAENLGIGSLQANLFGRLTQRCRFNRGIKGLDLPTREGDLSGVVR